MMFNPFKKNNNNVIIDNLINLMKNQLELLLISHELNDPILIQNDRYTLAFLSSSLLGYIKYKKINKDTNLIIYLKNLFAEKDLPLALLSNLERNIDLKISNEYYKNNKIFLKCPNEHSYKHLYDYCLAQEIRLSPSFDHGDKNICFVCIAILEKILRSLDVLFYNKKECSVKDDAIFGCREKIMEYLEDAKEVFKEGNAEANGK